MDKEEILVALTDGGFTALGNIWRITAKNSDFYLEPHGTSELSTFPFMDPGTISPGTVSISESTAGQCSRRIEVSSS